MSEPVSKWGRRGPTFLQSVDGSVDNLPIAETNNSFGQVIRVQALGDYKVLQVRPKNCLSPTGERRQQWTETGSRSHRDVEAGFFGNTSRL
jgi:hypothetical protein